MRFSVLTRTSGSAPGNGCKEPHQYINTRTSGSDPGNGCKEPHQYINTSRITFLIISEQYVCQFIHEQVSVQHAPIHMQRAKSIAPKSVTIISDGATKYWIFMI